MLKEPVKSKRCHIADEDARLEQIRRGRYDQAIRIGCVEMERIVEEVVVPEFDKVGEILMEAGYEVELVIFDSESPINDQIFQCGAGLRISRGRMKNAIVYTGDPYRFEFSLQTHNYVGRTTEREVAYHRMTPGFFHMHVVAFLNQTFPEVDFSSFKQAAQGDWEMLEGPFTVKLELADDVYEVVAEAHDIDEAMRLASECCGRYRSEDRLILEDSQGRKVC